MTLVGSEMCIRDRRVIGKRCGEPGRASRCLDLASNIECCCARVARWQRCCRATVHRVIAITGRAAQRVSDRRQVTCQVIGIRRGLRFGVRDARQLPGKIEHPTRSLARTIGYRRPVTRRVIAITGSAANRIGDRLETTQPVIDVVGGFCFGVRRRQHPTVAVIDSGRRTNRISNSSPSMRPVINKRPSLRIGTSKFTFSI